MLCFHVEYILYTCLLFRRVEQVYKKQIIYEINSLIEKNSLKLYRHGLNILV